MSEKLIECAEVAGKTVERLRLVRGEAGGQEIHIEFTDGTAFSLTIEPTTLRQARLLTRSDGQPETLRDYDE